MAILPILIGADNPTLRAKAKPVGKVTKKIQKLIKDMHLTMKEANGVGLAAPQIGESIRVALVSIGGKVVPVIDPVITQKSEQTALDEEGCLSLPNVWLPVPRSVEISLTYTDEKGEKQERKLKDFDARVVQHELDHLDGVLIIDYAEQVLAMIRQKKTVER